MGTTLAVPDLSREPSNSACVDLLPEARRYRTFHVVLVKPSKYDDDGYVIRFWKGVLPSNTLNVLRGLTEDVKQRRGFGGMGIPVGAFDEEGGKIALKKLIRCSPPPDTKLILCLVGVQTNQFPRALELGRKFRAHGIDVVIGGFHTSGTVNMLRSDEPAIQEPLLE